tara:strand:- start:607 stop:972 length:366 start_codon:yes stop_codon:yes gene_type:complete
MTRSEFIKLIADSGYQQDLSYLKEFISHHKTQLFSKDYFVEVFLQMVMELNETYPDKHVVQVVYTVTNDFLGPLELIPYMTDKEFMVGVVKWLKGILTLEYSVIDTTNPDYIILGQMFGDK